MIIGILVTGGARSQTPRIEPWLAGDGIALDSPPLFARLRRRRSGNEAEPASV